MLKTRHNEYNTIRMQVIPYRERAIVMNIIQHDVLSTGLEGNLNKIQCLRLKSLIGTIMHKK